MKIWWNSVVVLGIGVLLMIGYAIPSAISEWEDQHLESKTKRFEIEEVNFNSNEVDFVHELANFQELLTKDTITVEDKQLGTENNRSNEIAKQRVEDFLAMFNGNIPGELETSSVYSMVMVEKDGEGVYQIWKYTAIDREKREYLFWLDAITERVMAFNVPAEAIMSADEDAYAIDEDVHAVVRSLSEYYGFSSYDFLVEHNAKEWGGLLQLENEEKGEEVYLPIYKSMARITFNIYPDATSISVAK